MAKKKISTQPATPFERDSLEFEDYVRRAKRVGSFQKKLFPKGTTKEQIEGLFELNPGGHGFGAIFPGKKKRK